MTDQEPPLQVFHTQQSESGATIYVLKITYVNDDKAYDNDDDNSIGF